MTIPIHRTVQFRTDWGEVTIDHEKIIGFMQSRVDGRIRVKLRGNFGTVEEVALVTTWEAVQDFLRLVEESRVRNA